MTIENIITQYQGKLFITDKFSANNKSFSQTVGPILNGVCKGYAQIGTITKQGFECGLGLRCGDDQDIPYATQHKGRKRVKDHRFVVNGQQLFVDGQGDRMQPTAASPSHNDALHVLPSSFVNPKRPPSYLSMATLRHQS